MGSNTYIITRNSTLVTCSGPYQYGWLTPTRDWLDPYKCECKGALDISGITTLAWTCIINDTREWYWVHGTNGSIWRMMLNDPSNPHGLPVIGNYTMAHFTYETYNDSVLKTMYKACTETPQKSYYSETLLNKQPLTGFTYSGCPSTFPSWPDNFISTVTMVPVSLNNATPFPTLVVYNWETESQRTTMCEQTQVYNAYLTHSNTYILYQDLETKKLNCLSHFSFGPPKPNWMTLDKCVCKGTIEENPSLTPWKKTVIASCPVTDTRVFWTWFTNDIGFSPLLFFETLTPADEGTGLALADYHAIHKEKIFMDMKELEVPQECKN